MVFDSYGFLLVFLPCFLCGFWLLRYVPLPMDLRFRRTIMLLFLTLISVIFYWGFGAANRQVLALSVLWNTVFLRLIGKRRSRPVYITGLCGNILLLAFFKYSGVFLPVAISFYTFQAISLLTDVHRNEFPAPGILESMLYLLFFPKLIQGPIVRPADLKECFSDIESRDFDLTGFARGFTLLTMGLAKKVILAEVLGQAVGKGYEFMDYLSGLDCLLVAVCYSFQLYFDFSGYCDMGLGICRMAGLKLPLNFDSPYLATDITLFWKKWHISLTSFLTRYIYFPLGGSRRGALRTGINILIVFLISGIWHGAGVTFIIWGLLHGVLNVLTRAFRRRYPSFSMPKPLAVLLTFASVTAAWIFFRAPDTASALGMLTGIFTRPWNGIYEQVSLPFRLEELWYPMKFTPLADWSHSQELCMFIFLGLCSCLIFSGRTALKRAEASRLRIRDGICTGLLFAYSMLNIAGVSDFLYLNF